jgi:hypothetical protein
MKSANWRSGVCAYHDQDREGDHEDEEQHHEEYAGGM